MYHTSGVAVEHILSPKNAMTYWDSILRTLTLYANSKIYQESYIYIYIFDNKGKAEILNKQYDSIFTDENLEQTPQLGNSSVPSIDQLNITENGVCTLLKKLDPTKANGPDQIPTRILKEACLLFHICK